MFIYQPKQSILRDMTTNIKNVDSAYIKAQQILQKYRLPTDYMLTCVLRTHYKNVCFYSKKQCNHIPVNGYLFPVSMFDETNV